MGAPRKAPASGGARHFGLTAPYALPNSMGMQAAQPTNEFDSALAELARNKARIIQAQAFGLIDGGTPAGQAPLPQPQTVGDTLALGKFAVDVSQTIAKTATDQLEQTKDDLQKAKSNANDMFEAGKQEAIDLYDRLDAREERFRQEREEMRKEMANLREENRTAQENAKYAEIKAQLDALTTAHEQEKAELKRRAEKAETEVERFRSRTPQDVESEYLTALVQAKRFDHPALRDALGLTATGEEPFERTWQREMGQLEIAKAKKALTKQELLDMNAVEHNDAMNKKTEKLVDHLGDAIELGKKALENIVGGGVSTSSAGLPRHGMGATMSEMRAQAAAARQQQGGAQ